MCVTVLGAMSYAIINVFSALSYCVLGVDGSRIPIDLLVGIGLLGRVLMITEVWEVRLDICRL